MKRWIDKTLTCAIERLIELRCWLLGHEFVYDQPVTKWVCSRQGCKATDRIT